MENCELSVLSREIVIEKPPWMQKHCERTYRTVFGLLPGVIKYWLRASSPLKIDGWQRNAVRLSNKLLLRSTRSLFTMVPEEDGFAGSIIMRIFARWVNTVFAALSYS
jgi:hypothetical protein